MKILICAVQFKGGSLQVVISLINELKKFNDNSYFIVTSNEVNNQININEFGANFHFMNLSLKKQVGFINLLLRAKMLRKIEKNFKPDVVISTSGPIYWRSRAPHLMGYNLPAHVYNESPFFNQLSFYRKLRWKIKRIVHRLYFKRDAEAYFVQTDDVNQRLRKYINKEKIYTISNTFSNIYINFCKFPLRLPERTNGEIRLLTLTSYFFHKNLEIIPKVIDELGKKGIRNIKFILTIQKEYESKVQINEYKDKIINIGPISTKECPSLYEECDFMFLPTLLECFSASYAEAMIMKKPILTSDMGFAQTVCKDAAIYFNPIDPKDIAYKIAHLIDSPDVQNKLIGNGLRQLKQFGNAHQRASELLKLCKVINK
jgi:glycosyltransferase involved in cell wall biosynthesis